MLQKRFKFIKDYNDLGGGTIKKGTLIEVIDNNIFMQSGTYGGQILDKYTYESIVRFIEKETKSPNFLREIPVEYNKV